MFKLCKRFMNYVRVKNAIRHANRMQQLTRKQHFVIKIHDQIHVYDRNKINYLIDCGILKKELRGALELRKISIYFTK